jgi:hypothetical protein
MQQVRKWWKGVHPDKGTITRGFTGLETVEEKRRVIPMHIFTVDD